MEKITPVRRFELTGEEVYHSYHEGKSKTSGIYIKRPHEGNLGYGDVNQERKSYEVINPYLRMPYTHLLERDGYTVLAIQKVFGECLGTLYLSNPVKASECLLRYTNDLNTMWQKSVQPMNTEKLSAGYADLKSGFIRRVRSFLTFPETQEFLKDDVTINGIMYSNLESKVSKILHTLEFKQDPLITLGHGDDHLGNIFDDCSKNNYNYYIIDPRLSGYYSPAISYLNAAMYLFLYRYPFLIQRTTCNGKIELTYKISPRFKESAMSISKILKVMEENLSTISTQFMTREYIVANLLRFVQKQNDRKNFSHTVPNTLAYLAIAIELMNNKYSYISEIYESLC